MFFFFFFLFLQIQDCRFHSCLDVRRPKSFFASAARFEAEGGLFRVVTDPFAEDVNAASHKARAAKKKKPRLKQLHDGMKVEEQNARGTSALSLYSIFLLSLSSPHD